MMSDGLITFIYVIEVMFAISAILLFLANSYAFGDDIVFELWDDNPSITKKIIKACLAMLIGILITLIAMPVAIIFGTIFNFFGWFRGDFGRDI